MSVIPVYTLIVRTPEAAAKAARAARWRRRAAALAIIAAIAAPSPLRMLGVDLGEEFDDVAGTKPVPASAMVHP